MLTTCFTGGGRECRAGGERRWAAAEMVQMRDAWGPQIWHGIVTGGAWGHAEEQGLWKPSLLCLVVVSLKLGAYVFIVLWSAFTSYLGPAV